MKVIELINRLNEIGYDENTELTFSCIDGDSGEYYDIPFEEISCGEDLTGEPYCNDVIDIEVNVDAAEDYIKDKSNNRVYDIVNNLIEVLKGYDPY
uniref:hypothetical protein n=1 Tax=Coprococcus catus TaxID=116085 RepID=UPI0022E0D9F7|nr:hypothetical protein [Coprococcus catus]